MVLFEKFSRSDALDDLDDLLGQHHRYRLDQKMYVVLVCPDFKKMYFVTFFNLKTDVPQGCVDWFGEYHSAVLRRTHQMVQHHGDVMFLVYEDTHQTSLSRSRAAGHVP